ncbi:MAG: isopenicillin N synthase family oxygenase [Gammaproteobacteria bacterium]|nr:isopenicillin N synthase family oxygenase [Gammaproteobacteria bacterium]MBT8056659.1 isopenicillin N synthase family oxygenase [Gammaproteobacteria bacterium]NNJ79852.1 isopenicillin N synthase family oxygenase [Xanthomonadales bacterium]
MTQQVPVIDLTRLAGDAETMVAEAGLAYREYGFCGFRNHGIPNAVIKEAYDAIHRFFELPLTAKLVYRSSDGGQRGYTPLGTERARDNPVPDLKEFWHTGREMPGENPWPDIMRPNRWPEEVPGFRPAVTALYEELDRLGRRILAIIARSMALDETIFDPAVDRGNSILRAIHYPPVTGADTPAVRAARHEDINLITLLIGSSEAGLEILARDGSWMPVTSIPGTIVVNIGDMMRRLTNHVLPSTPHRVVNPPGTAGGQSRYSIPFFMHPNPDYVIRTLPQCITARNPDRYPEPISSHEFLLQRLRENAMM